MRFINARSQNIDAEIVRALADMVNCTGIDRAYFVLSGPAPRQHVWCRAGMSFSPGWPERAPVLAARFGPAADGIVHAPRVSRMPPGENKDACVALGIGGWACVTNVDEDGTCTMLGFDTMGRPCLITDRDEFSLMRMALETIVYAVERHTMEKERARLETRLQQAQRMETVGMSGTTQRFSGPKHLVQCLLFTLRVLVVPPSGSIRSNCLKSTGLPLASSFAARFFVASISARCDDGIPIGPSRFCGHRASCARSAQDSRERAGHRRQVTDAAVEGFEQAPDRFDARRHRIQVTHECSSRLSPPDCRS
jgi:hypothetical protein